MKEQLVYAPELEANVIVEHCVKKEIMEIIGWYIEDKNDGYDLSDNALYVLYKDGTQYIDIEGDNPEKFRKSNIVAAIVDNGNTYQVWGDVEIGENGVAKFATH